MPVVRREGSPRRPPAAPSPQDARGPGDVAVPRLHLWQLDRLARPPTRRPRGHQPRPIHLTTEVSNVSELDLATQVAEQHGLPASIASRLRGSTADELAADAADLRHRAAGQGLKLDAGPPPE